MKKKKKFKLLKLSMTLLFVFILILTIKAAMASQDLCKNKACNDYCSGNILFSKGSCNSTDGSCVYSNETCQYGCDDSTLKCNNKPAEDKCKNKVCSNYCSNSISFSNGKCDSNTGDCIYSSQTCESGCAGLICHFPNSKKEKEKPKAGVLSIASEEFAVIKWSDDELKYNVVNDKKNKKVCLVTKPGYMTDVEMTIENTFDTVKTTDKLSKQTDQQLCVDYKNKNLKKGDKIKFGNHSIILVYQPEKRIRYIYDFGETNIYLYKNYSIMENLFVTFNQSKLKFGAIDTKLPMNTTANYTYVLNSTSPVVLITQEYNNITYPIVYNFYQDENLKEWRYFYNFKDICTKNYSNCSWSLIDNSFTVHFASGRNIDPTIDFVAPSTANNTLFSSAPNSVFINLTTTTVSGDHYAFVDWDNSLMSWYRFDNDSSVGENNTKLYNWKTNILDGNCGTSCPNITTSKYGKASNFTDGNKGAFWTVTATPITNEYTISAWVLRPTTTADPGYDTIVATEGYKLQIGAATNTVIWGLMGSSQTSVSTSINGIVNNAWQHIVAVKNGTNYKIYINGTLYISETNNIALNGASTERIGAAIGDQYNINGFPGQIDELLLFNRSLSSDEVLSLYNATINQYQHNFTVNVPLKTYTSVGYTVNTTGDMNTTGLYNYTTPGFISDCLSLLKGNTTYYLVNDINYSTACIVVAPYGVSSGYHNYTIEGQGYIMNSTLTSEAYAITINGGSLGGGYLNHTVNNITFNNRYGISGNWVSNSTFSNLTFNNTVFGINLASSGNYANRYNLFSNNVFNNNIYALYLRNLYNNSVKDNLFNGNSGADITLMTTNYTSMTGNLLTNTTPINLSLTRYGVYFLSAINNDFNNNILENQRYSIYYDPTIFGTSNTYLFTTTSLNNTIDGRLIYINRSQSSKTIPSNVSMVYCQQCSNMIAADLSLFNNWVDILATSITLTNVSSQYSYYGAYTAGSLILSNSQFNNNRYAVYSGDTVTVENMTINNSGFAMSGNIKNISGTGVGYPYPVIGGGIITDCNLTSPSVVFDFQLNSAVVNNCNINGYISITGSNSVWENSTITGNLNVGGGATSTLFKNITINTLQPNSCINGGIILTTTGAGNIFNNILLNGTRIYIENVANEVNLSNIVQNNCSVYLSNSQHIIFSNFTKTNDSANLTVEEAQTGTTCHTNYTVSSSLESCTNITQSSVCSTYGCTWGTDVCIGDTEGVDAYDCNTLSNAACDIIYAAEAKCVWNPGLYCYNNPSPTVTDCNTYSSDQTGVNCQANTNHGSQCSWDAPDCSGSLSCYVMYSDKPACEALSHCYYTHVCSGTVDCSVYGDEPTCSTYNLKCGWQPTSCTGTLACSSLATDEPTCSSYSLCTWDSGNSVCNNNGDCSTLTPGTDCSNYAAGGCSNVNTCEETSTDCSDLDYDNCQIYNGCNKNSGSCNNVDTCADITNDTECATYNGLGCTWNGGVCSGNVYCATFGYDSTGCEAEEGCSVYTPQCDGLNGYTQYSCSGLAANLASCDADGIACFGVSANCTGAITNTSCNFVDSVLNLCYPEYTSGICYQGSDFGCSNLYLINSTYDINSENVHMSSDTCNNTISSEWYYSANLEPDVSYVDINITSNADTCIGLDETLCAQKGYCLWSVKKFHGRMNCSVYNGDDYNCLNTVGALCTYNYGTSTCNLIENTDCKNLTNTLCDSYDCTTYYPTCYFDSAHCGTKDANYFLIDNKNNSELISLVEHLNDGYNIYNYSNYIFQATSEDYPGALFLNNYIVTGNMNDLFDFSPNITYIFPLNGSWLDRILSPNLSVIVDSHGRKYSVEFFDGDSNSLAYLDNKDNGTVSQYIWANLIEHTSYYWYVNISDGITSKLSQIWQFIPNDEPQLLNLRAEVINKSSILFIWQNEADGEWSSRQIGSETLQISAISATDENWTASGLTPDSLYLYKWQSGDNLTAMSDYHNFNIRTKGWMPELENYTYKRLITIPANLISDDKGNWAINLTLNDTNFLYSGGLYYNTLYTSFPLLNYSNLNDVRFADYYETSLLRYNLTNYNLNGEGCQEQQYAPDEIYCEDYTDVSYAYDDDFGTRAIPNTLGTCFFNYTIPANVKLNDSMLRLRLSDDWYWDGSVNNYYGLESNCMTGDKFEIKVVSDYVAGTSVAYCKNQDSNTWQEFFSGGKYLYGVMMTWLYSCSADFTIMPLHYNDTIQALTEGLDANYSVKLWMYYGNVNAENNFSSISYDGILNADFIIGDQETEEAGLPVISNVVDNIGRTATSTNISWVIDQGVDSRVQIATNPFYLNAYYVNKSVNNTETFSHVYADDITTYQLIPLTEDWNNIISVNSSNPLYNSEYTITAETAGLPVNITFNDVNDLNYYDWNVTYNYNKSRIRNNKTAQFEIDSLETDTIYYYKLWAYGIAGNTSYTGNFTLGTVPSTPQAIYYNYTEDRPSSTSTVCFNITNLNGDSSLTASIQYWNEASVVFNETITSTEGLGVFCRVINLDYGHNYTYRAKLVGTRTGYSQPYSNDFMPIQEFFAGSYIKDDNDDRDREYCPIQADGTADTNARCYQQKGYLEGSNMNEDWIYIETNISTGSLTLVWWDGEAWTNYAMLSADAGFKYKELRNLNTNWQTFYIRDSLGDTVLNWTKPSMNHSLNNNRTDESKFVSFNWTYGNLSYTQLYLGAIQPYIGSYDWCIAQPGGNLYNCMNVEYWGGGRESGINEDLSGTEYDRGQLFRGGILNGMPHDTGVLNPFIQNDTSLEEARWCFAFTSYFFNKSISVQPGENITNYYVRFWTQTQSYSDYLGHVQDAYFDNMCLFNWTADTLSNTRDWKCVEGTNLSVDGKKDESYQPVKLTNSVLNASNVSMATNYNASLLVTFVEGFNIEIPEDAIYNYGFYTHGQWVRQLFGRHEQAFIIFNLPDNGTLQSMDTDHDTINDYNELFTYYTNPNSTDTDQDGRLDNYELLKGYNPNIFTSNNTAPVISIIALNSTAADLIVTTELRYTDEDADNGNLYVRWYVNNNNVVNSTFYNLANSDSLTTQLSNVSFSVGSVITVKAYGIDNYSGTGPISNSSITVNFGVVYEPPVTGGGGGGGGWVTVLGNNTDGIIQKGTDGKPIYEPPVCKPKEKLYERLLDNCSYFNEVCEDGETPMHPDCKVSPEVLACNGTRCMFHEIWFAKVLLIVIVLLLIYYKSDYLFFILAGVIILAINFSTSAAVEAVKKNATPVLQTPQNLSNQGTFAIINNNISNIWVMVSELVNKYGGMIMPSNPTFGFVIGVVLLYVIYRWLFSKAQDKLSSVISNNKRRRR